MPTSIVIKHVQMPCNNRLSIRLECAPMHTPLLASITADLDTRGSSLPFPPLSLLTPALAGPAAIEDSHAHPMVQPTLCKYTLANLVLIY